MRHKPGASGASSAGILGAAHGRSWVYMPFSDFPPVLVVDDVPMIAEVVVATLSKLGFRDIDTAADGTVALSKLHARRYGLVISDWNMHPMTGQELLRQVRSSPGLRETPFIMMTTQANADRFSAARQAGVNGCLIKPFTPAKLRDVIVAVCGNGQPGAISTAFL